MRSSPVNRACLGERGTSGQRRNIALFRRNHFTAKVNHGSVAKPGTRAWFCTLAGERRAGKAQAWRMQMLKTAKYGLATVLIAGASGFAFAQGEPPKGSDPSPPAAVKQQPGETKAAPAAGVNAPAPGAHKQVQNPTAPAAQGAQTGTAADPAGPGAERNAKGSGNPQGPKGMTQRPTGMPTTPGNAGTETGTAPDPAGPGGERKGGNTK